MLGLFWTRVSNDMFSEMKNRYFIVFGEAVGFASVFILQKTHRCLYC